MWISLRGELTVRFWDLKGESNFVGKWLLVDQFSAEVFLHVAGTLKILSTFVMYFLILSWFGSEWSKNCQTALQKSMLSFWPDKKNVS